VTSTAKFLIDENIPPCIVQDLVHLLRHAKDEETAHIKHVHSLYSEWGFNTQGVWDEVWIPKIAEEGWTIVAGDRGKASGKGKKLPDLCVQHTITHVLLSPGVHQRSKFPKLLTILSVWHELVAIGAGPRGLRYFIEPLSGLQSQCGRGKLVQKTIPLSAPPPNGMLFRK
jgi:hypothetical protein